MTISATTGTVFIVDDDDGVRDSLSWLLRTRRLLSETFSSGESFVEHIEGFKSQGPVEPCCVLLDLRMTGISGLEVFQKLLDKEWHDVLPVIFLSGHADVPIAVDAVRRGAYDFCEKPFSDNALVDRITQALAKSYEKLATHKHRSELQSLINELTEREREVMTLMADGLPNKLIADHLNISIRTVEVHRAKIFDKLNLKSIVDLIHMLHTLDLT